MTKVRPPLSFERALTRIAEHVGYPAMGAAIGKKPRTIQDYADHDTSTGITLADAFVLEDLYVQNGGEGAPISDCWRLRLGITRANVAREKLLEKTAKVIKEGGEAHAALVIACSPGATTSDVAKARRELEEYVAEGTSTLALLDDSTGLDGGDERASPGGEP